MHRLQNHETKQQNHNYYTTYAEAIAWYNVLLEGERASRCDTQGDLEICLAEEQEQEGNAEDTLSKEKHFQTRQQNTLSSNLQCELSELMSSPAYWLLIQSLHRV